MRSIFLVGSTLSYPYFLYLGVMVKKEYGTGVTMLKKKIFLDRKKTKWCICQLYNYKYDMQQAYLKYCKERGQKGSPVLGASVHYSKLVGNKKSGETGIVFLCVKNCSAGIVTHELLHAVLWAYKHKTKPSQYPIVIKSMREEETILHNHTFAVNQFYRWFWKVTKDVNS